MYWTTSTSRNLKRYMQAFFLRIKSFTYNTLRFKDSPKNTYIAHKCNFKCVKFCMNY